MQTYCKEKLNWLEQIETTGVNTLNTGVGMLQTRIGCV